MNEYEAWKLTQRFIAERLTRDATYTDWHTREALIDSADSFGGLIIAPTKRAILKAAGRNV